MDKIKHYQKILTDWLTQYAEIKPANLPQTENHVVIDLDHGHFQLLREGWHNQQFVFNVVFHFHLKQDGKIWVLANNTDIPLDQEFASLHVPKEDLIPGFQPEAWRRLAGYAA